MKTNRDRNITNILTHHRGKRSLRGLLHLIMLVMFCFSMNAQEPITKGKYNAFRGDYDNKIADTMAGDRNSALKADYDAQRLIETNYDSLDVWVVQPDLYYGNKAPSAWYELSMSDKIIATDITDTSVTIRVWLGLFDKITIRFRPAGNEWESGGEWIEASKGEDKTLFKDALMPNTVYEYQVIVDYNISHIMEFKTL